MLNSHNLTLYHCHMEHYYSSDLSDEQTEAQRGRVICFVTKLSTGSQLLIPGLTMAATRGLF